MKDIRELLELAKNEKTHDLSSKITIQGSSFTATISNMVDDNELRTIRELVEDVSEPVIFFSRA